MAPRRILHVDMDAFFVSVELLDHPELRGRPVVVGGTGARGVVAAASYEARAYGVHSAQPSAVARRRCPQAVFLPGRHARYGEVSAVVMAIFADVTPLVEPLSLDEAFLDVTGAERAFGPAPQIAATIRARVADEVGITCSVGIATSKFVAKLASERAKPTASPDGPIPGRGVYEVPAGREVTFIRSLPLTALWGVGPATLAKLDRLGVSTVAQLAELPAAAITGAVGQAHGEHLIRLANGVDDRPVVPSAPIKSVSHEETFATDLTDRDELHRELVRMADAVARRLRAASLAGRTVQIKVRDPSFATITRSSTVSGPVDDGAVILAEAARLLASVDVGRGVRLLGVGVSNLTTDPGRQLTLDLTGDSPAGATRHDANKVVDEIRARFGSRAIGPARLAGGDRLATFEQGQQQWGPDRPAAEGDPSSPPGG